MHKLIHNIPLLIFYCQRSIVIPSVSFLILAPLTPADNSRIAGWNRVRSFLAPVPDGLGGETPRWQCFDCCPNLIRQLPMLQFDKLDREDAADGDDHAPEALRYALMSRPRPGPSPAPARRSAYDPLSLPEPEGGWYSS